MLKIAIATALAACAAAAALLARRARRARTPAEPIPLEPPAAPSAELLTIASLHVFPVKGCAGSEADALDVDEWGLAGDRRFMVYRAGAVPRFVSQRQLPGMALLHASSREEGEGGAIALSLASRVAAGPLELWGRSPLATPREFALRVDVRGVSAAPRVAVEIWGSTVEAIDLGDGAARWLSAQLRARVRLCWVGPGFRRPVEEGFVPAYALRAGGAPPQVAFSDGYPLLLTGTASLRRLNAAIARAGGAPVLMDRFRANMVVHTEEPFEEDRWRRVRIGEVEFAVVKGCSRCKVPTIDQATGKAARSADGRAMGEPQETLKKFRRHGDVVYFGQNLVQVGCAGTVRRGDRVVVLERGDALITDPRAVPPPPE